MSRKVNFRSLTVGLFAAVIMLTPASVEGEWTYTYFKEVRPLTTLDTFRLAVFDPTPSALTSSARVVELRARQEGVPSKTPTGDLGNGWIFLDLTGTPSAGDPAAVEVLAEEIANDPAGDEFVSLIFLFGDQAAFVTPRLHVGFQVGVSLATVQQILSDAGVGEIVESDWIRPNIFIVDAETRSGMEALNAANALAQLPEVYFAAVDWGLTGESLTQAIVEYPPESILATSSTTNHLSALPRKDAPAPLCGPLGVAVPNDPFLSLSWGLEYFNDLDVDAYEAWQVCSGSPQVMAAVLGDGVPLDHPDMPNVLPGADFTNQCESPPCLGQPQTSCDMHETAVASIIHAAANNGIASAGVAPDVSILPIRVGWYWLSGSTCVGQLFQSTLADGIDFAVSEGARLTSLSWNFFDQLSPVVAISYQKAYEAGVINFTSAGNGNLDRVFAPGNLFEVHSISGIDFTGALFYVSNTYASNWGRNVDFTGPGRFVFALDRVGPEGYEDETGPYGADAVSLTGTSFACPHIAGVAALILARNPALGPEEVFYLLRETALDLGDPGRDDFFGYGLCKAASAVAQASDVIAIRTFERGDFTGLVVVIE